MMCTSVQLRGTAKQCMALWHIEGHFRDLFSVPFSRKRSRKTGTMCHSAIMGTSHSRTGLLQKSGPTPLIRVLGLRVTLPVDGGG